MELFDNLASHGLTITVLQTLIVCAGLLFVVYVIGMYWQFILTGFGILFCIAVFAMPSKQDKPVIEKQTQQEERVEQVQPENPPVVEVKPEIKESKEQADERMFLEDCNLHSGYTQAQCKALWESDKAEIEKSAWRYKHGKNAVMQKVKYGA